MDREELVGYIQRLEARLGAPVRAWLFGSRAQGTALRESDVDLILVSEGFTGMGWLDRLRLAWELWESRPSLNALCYTPEEFSTLSREPTIVQEALRHALLITPSPQKRYR